MVQSKTAEVNASSAKNKPSPWTSDTAVLAYLACATVAIHLWTGGRYGFHRDELATLEDARHLAWGFVAYPPVTPFFGRLSLELFGTTLRGFRFFAAVAEAIAVILTGLMVRELGGGRWAQIVAAVAALPFCLAAGSLMQYVSFDYLAWILVAYCTLRLLKSENPRWWIGIGASIGFGMMSKYAMPFFVAGLIVGVLLSDARRYLTSRWLWLGAAVSILIFLPNLIWQAQHNFVSLDFLRHIHTRDVGEGRAKGFIPGQLKFMLAQLPLFIAGLYYLFSSSGKRYRVLGWMYLTPLLIFIVAKGRDYYLAGAYPMVFAAGAFWLERWLSKMRPARFWAWQSYVWISLAGGIAFVSMFFLPIAPVHSHWFKVESGVNGDLREEFGWPELVQTVAAIRDKLPQQDRTGLGIIGTNYGEAGAINLYGPQYGLPRAISGVNSFWYRGYGDPPPQVVIVLGLKKKFLDEKFTSCQVAAHTWNYLGIQNEETEDHPDIFVCRGLRQNWPEFWEHFHYYG